MSIMPIYYTQEQLNELVAQWLIKPYSQPLHEYLGVSLEDYDLWVKNPEHKLLIPLDRL